VTGILPKRQKFIGLNPICRGKLLDEFKLNEVKLNKKREFILMGTVEKKFFIDPLEKDDLPEVIDDFDLDFVAGSEEWVKHIVHGNLLKDFTKKTEIYFMHQPREGKPLLVLDLDHTLLDFSVKHLSRADSSEVGDHSTAVLKRPYMDNFLSSAYRYYDMAVWSQTSWRWLETKLTELGMVRVLGDVQRHLFLNSLHFISQALYFYKLTNPHYRFCFVLDKTSMFKIESKKKDGIMREHYVKPLQIIWTKFSRWGSHNTVHIDDLKRNFALNIGNNCMSAYKCFALIIESLINIIKGSGLLVSPFYRKKRKSAADCELLAAALFLEKLAEAKCNFDTVNFQYWKDIVSGKMIIKSTDSMDKKRPAE